ncbi:hypothetical protein QAD02_017741 [Eretmocerus hayati]|uniref:Uncharacterized protein n=1 Tax=Eretmocerus hayati TaxID=131215 RepID=A0ACC2PH89_9HYME|nr:hypothetical protein QAD02_017741 [Eretmocerus hayati]
MHRRNASSENLWDPQKVFQCPSDYKYAMVILNRPICLHQDQVLPLWRKARVTITVDGGTDRWMKYIGDQAQGVLSGTTKTYLPTFITGDMDSIAPSLLKKLQLIKANVIYTLDQSETDYTKALIQLKQYMMDHQEKLDGVYILTETSGRFDQIISNINTLYKSFKFLNGIPVIQIACDSLTWLLKPGRHKILVPDILLKNESWCALIPFGDSNNCVTTTGLKWNLDRTCLRFGGLISTSNTYDGTPEVTIDTDVFLVWAMGIESITGVTA